MAISQSVNDFYSLKSTKHTTLHTNGVDIDNFVEEISPSTVGATPMVASFKR